MFVCWLVVNRFADAVHCADYVLGTITSGPKVEDFLDQVRSARWDKITIKIFIIHFQTELVLLHSQNTDAKISEGIYFLNKEDTNNKVYHPKWSNGHYRHTYYNRKCMVRTRSSSYLNVCIGKGYGLCLENYARERGREPLKFRHQNH